MFHLSSFFIVNGNYCYTITLVHTTLMIALIIDILLYTVRWMLLIRKYKAYNLVIFIHMLIHYALIANTSVAIKYYLFYTDSEEQERNDVTSFMFIYIFVIFRVFYYTCITIVIIPFIPCFLYSIIKKRRNRLRLYEYIREERRRSLGSFAFLNEPARNILPPQNATTQLKISKKNHY